MRERVRACQSGHARVYDGPRVWVLTATPVEAARGPATRRSEIGGRETVRVRGMRPGFPSCAPCGSKASLTDRMTGWGGGGREVGHAEKQR